MSFTGVDATVASNIALAVKYAFVGENPEIRATSEAQFNSYWTGGTPVISESNIASADKLIDSLTDLLNIDNKVGIWFSLLCQNKFEAFDFRRNRSGILL